MQKRDSNNIQTTLLYATNDNGPFKMWIEISSFEERLQYVKTLPVDSAIFNTNRFDPSSIDVMINGLFKASLYQNKILKNQRWGNITATGDIIVDDGRACENMESMKSAQI